MLIFIVIMKEIVCSRNTYTSIFLSVDFACMYGHGSGTWPVECYAPIFDVSVNAQYGGGAGLVLCSCGYGGKGPESNSEAFLLR